MDNANDKKLSTKEIVDRDIILNCSMNIRDILHKINSAVFNDIEEIRLRLNRPLMLSCCRGDYMVNRQGEFTNNFQTAYIVSQTDIQQSLELMSDNSLYAFQEELKGGFLTLNGGHRVGVAGKVILEKNEIKTLKEISSLNIRIARQVKGCAKDIMSFIINNNSIFHTLVISPPGCGKTTMLRDAIRIISNGIESLKYKGAKVGLVDERSEIAACFRGKPQNDVGIRTDILDSCPKPYGILMLVRSMSPKVIATDELGTKDDLFAVEEALNAGIKIITTVHAKDIEELSRKPNIGQLFRQKQFERIIILSNSNGPGTIEDIIDGNSLSSIWRCKNVC